MTREANVELIRRSFDAFETMDIEAWTADWDPEIVFDVSGYEPWHGEQKVYRGIADILAFFGEMMAGTKVLKLDVHEVSAVDDERVIALYSETRQEPGGPPHDVDVGIVYRLRDERMAEVWVHSDHDAARRTAGLS